jgi:hypothetical protein
MTPPDDNPSRADYSTAALTACRRALGTLVKDVGVQECPRLVVIGGLVPALLLDAEDIDPLLRDDPHPGTNDVDLCVQIDLPEEDADLYRRLEHALDREGYERRPRKDGRGESVWGWGRKVGEVNVVLEFLAPADGVVTRVGERAPGRIALGAPTREGDRIGALRMRGAGLALRDAVPKQIVIDLVAPPGEAEGGVARVTVWTANVLPFIALKSFAVQGREKDKDCFDLVWLMNHWRGGPAAAAAAARQSPVADDPEVAAALDLLAFNFADPEREGCARYARFSLGKQAVRGSGAWVRHARDAREATREFLDAWNARGSTTKSGPD